MTRDFYVPEKTENELSRIWHKSFLGGSKGQTKKKTTDSNATSPKACTWCCGREGGEEGEEEGSEKECVCGAKKCVFF